MLPLCRSAHQIGPNRQIEKGEPRVPLKNTNLIEDDSRFSRRFAAPLISRITLQSAGLQHVII